MKFYLINLNGRQQKRPLFVVTFMLKYARDLHRTKLMLNQSKTIDKSTRSQRRRHRHMQTIHSQLAIIRIEIALSIENSICVSIFPSNDLTHGYSRSSLFTTSSHSITLRSGHVAVCMVFVFFASLRSHSFTFLLCEAILFRLIISVFIYILIPLLWWLRLLSVTGTPYPHLQQNPQMSQKRDRENNNNNNRWNTWNFSQL